MSRPDSKAINAAIRLRPFDFEAWGELAQMDPASLITEGNAILRYKAQLIEAHLPYAKIFQFEGFQLKAVNCTSRDFFSELAGKLAEETGLGGVWVDQGETQLWSVRGEGAKDLAVRLGGGGHAKAAGFSCAAGTGPRNIGT